MWISVGSAAIAWLATMPSAIVPANHRNMNPPLRIVLALQDDRIVLACNPAFCRHVVTALDRFTIMRASYLFAALLLMMSGVAHAEPPKLAVFDFEMIDTSLQGEVSGLSKEEQARLAHT